MSAKKILAFVMAVVLVLSLVPAVAAAETEIRFDFGANGSAAHVDGSDVGTAKTYTEGDYELALTGCVKVFDGAFDLTGNSCLKLGTSSAIGTFTFAVPEDVIEVVIYAAKYKAKNTALDINGTQYTLSNSSNDGLYEEIIIDTSATKTICLATVSGKARTMIDAIVYKVASGAVVEPSETAPEETTAPTEPSETTPEETTAPTEPSEPSVETTIELVEAPQAGVAYKMAMNNGNMLYFNGQTESASVTYRLATSTAAADAIDVYLEAVEGVEGGYRLYFMNGETKTYIRVYERTDGDAGYGKGSLELVTDVPAEYYTYDATAKTLFYAADADNAYYMGTYSTYSTFSVSNTSYITGDKAANVDVSQYPARFYIVENEEPDVTEPSETTPEETTAPTEPSETTPEETTAPTEPSEPSVETTIELVEAPQAGVAYKMAMNNGNMLYFNGQTESASVTYRLATSTAAADAIDVYLEAVEGVEGGYRLYFMNGETKTYIRVYERTDGDAGYGKGSLELVTDVPAEYYTYDATAKTLFYAADADNAYYMGTYSTYSTFSVSNTSYITGDNAANVDVSQYPARFYAVVESQEPEVTDPAEPEVVVGDMNGDAQVNNDDVVALLWNTLFPTDYPLSVNADLNGDGEVNNDDVAKLLWNTLFPEDYPL